MEEKRYFCDFIFGRAIPKNWPTIRLIIKIAVALVVIVSALICFFCILETGILIGKVLLALILGFAALAIITPIVGLILLVIAIISLLHKYNDQQGNV